MPNPIFGGKNDIHGGVTLYIVIEKKYNLADFEARKDFFRSKCGRTSREFR